MVDQEEPISFKDEELKKNLSIIDLRNLIAKNLSTGDKTEEDLKKLIPGATYEELVLALRNMLTLKLIKKEGFPIKYSLSLDIKEKLAKRKEISNTDQNPIKVSIIIESMASDKGALRNAMEEILERLRKDPNYKVYEASLAEVVVQEATSLFSTYIEAEVSCLDFQSLLKLIYYYGVTSIDVNKPEKLTVSISDLQEGLFAIVDMTHGYADMIYKLKQEMGHLKK
ncbi:MAG: hypothetical protein WCF78_02900 [archaeon]